LRLVGVNGPYSVLLSADAYTGLSETSDNGYASSKQKACGNKGYANWRNFAEVAALF
jgi:uncharacterized linocin/CFP29 family protein